MSIPFQASFFNGFFRSNLQRKNGRPLRPAIFFDRLANVLEAALASALEGALKSVLQRSLEAFRIDRDCAALIGGILLLYLHVLEVYDSLHGADFDLDPLDLALLQLRLGKVHVGFIANAWIPTLSGSTM